MIHNKEKESRLGFLEYYHSIYSKTKCNIILHLFVRTREKQKAFLESYSNTNIFRCFSPFANNLKTNRPNTKRNVDTLVHILGVWPNPQSQTRNAHVIHAGIRDCHLRLIPSVAKL